MQCEVATFTPYKNLTETRENNLQSRPRAEICTGSSDWKKRSNARTGLQRYDHVIQSLPRILNRRNKVRVDGVDKVSAALHCTHMRKCISQFMLLLPLRSPSGKACSVIPSSAPQSYRNTSHQTTISRYKTTAHRQDCGHSITTASHW